MKHVRSILAILLSLTMIFSLVACNTQGNVELTSLTIENCERETLEIGYTLQLETNAPDEIKDKLDWEASNEFVTIDDNGFVTAKSEGTVAITVTYKDLSDSAIIYVVEADENNDYPQFEEHEDNETTTNKMGQSGGNSQQDEDDRNHSNSSNNGNSGNSGSNIIPFPNSSLPVDEDARAEFYGDSDPADSYQEAIARSAKGMISGAEEVPDQAPTLSDYMPKKNGAYIRNSEPYYIDDNTYVVVNAYGEEVFRVYRGGGYITLEEVAAYLYAFGDVPANYISGKNKDPESSIWGEYLRLNHSKFSGNTKKYPYEPMLPDISGCGGDLTYYEVDIGTTGTDCDPHYSIKIYNDGRNITRGAARIVYTRFDANGNKIIDPNEKYLFYTYNHYNDFQEYLNYYGGWGEMFGNITGGGTLSSKYDYNPTKYVPVVMAELADYECEYLPAAQIFLPIAPWKFSLVA